MWLLCCSICVTLQCLPSIAYLVQVALKLLNCWESIAGANRDVFKPYVNALLPHVVGDS
jgi:hypothetical protein